MQITEKQGKLRLEVGEPGIHPFLSLQLPDADGGWYNAAVLGARQVRYFHKGASLPRVISGGDERESGESLQLAVDGSGTTLTTTDERGGFRVESRLTLEGGPVLHVVHTLEALEAVPFSRIFDRYDFLPAPGDEAGRELDYVFTPHLRPRDDMVIGDHAFRSPAVMLQRGEVFFALMPDLELLAPAYERGPERYYMDLVATGGENQNPAACFGIGRVEPTGHLYFKQRFKQEQEVPEGHKLTLAYYLVLDDGGFGPRDVLAFMWERFGKRYLAEGLPQTVGLDRYASAGLTRMFKRSDLFHTFELEGQRCGGTIGIHLATRKGVRLMNRAQLSRFLRTQDLSQAMFRLGTEHLVVHPAGARLLDKVIYRYGPRVPPEVLFSVFFNNLRSAYGAYWFARKWHDHELLENALAVKNLAILAPGEEGAFPAVCYPTDEGVFWSRGTRVFKHVDTYHTADCAITAYHMAQWYADHEGDPRLLKRCRDLARFLLNVQQPSGAFPAWAVPGEPPRISPELKESATTACPAMFLAKLFLIDSDARHLQAAIEAGEFLATQVIPQQKWFDCETFFSCSTKRQGMYDSNTASYAQNTLSMYWAAEAFRLLHLATLDPAYLELGIRVLDHLCLYQQVWDPPFLSVNLFGGFGVMNTDGEWNDARQGLIAPVLMDYYRATGNPEYMERGIAALRAAFTTMYIEENRRVAPGNMEGFRREELGSVPENYGHFGYDMRTTGYLQSDWGAGSASYAAAYAQKHYGDIFVDVGAMRAFGINGCRVDAIKREGDELHLEVEKLLSSNLELVVKLSGEGPHGLRVTVNGDQARKTPGGDFQVLL